MRKMLFGILLSCFVLNSFANSLPNDFVYLKDIDPTIQQDIRYATAHNFIGRRIGGYQAPECILTKPAALALAKVQKELQRLNLSLKVYDCYRPQMAVNDFIAWSKDPSQQQMKKEFYPRINKKDFFRLGYVASKSGHTRGSTVDLTIVPIPTARAETYEEGQALRSCFAPYHKRFFDGGIDMGTGYDCLDQLAHPFNPAIDAVAHHNRMLLRNIMLQYGFNPMPIEWWHFTLKNEPFPKTYFNFPITSG